MEFVQSLVQEGLSSIIPDAALAAGSYRSKIFTFQDLGLGWPEIAADQSVWQ